MALDQQKKLKDTEPLTISKDEEPKGSENSMGKTRLQQTNNTAKIQRTSKKERMLSNPDVKRWYLNLSTTSKENADVSLRRLRKFCEDHDISPMQFVEIAMRDIKTATDMIADHLNEMDLQGKAPQYQKKVLTTTKSWLDHFGLKPTRKIRIRNMSSTPTLENERVPEGHEMSEISNRSSLRTGTMVSLMSKCGVRPQVMGNHDATDGLMMKDLPDIAIIQGVAVCLRSPPMVIVRRTLSKTGHQYFTFMTSQGTKKLLAYLNHRLARGEPLSADSSVIAPDSEHHYGRGNNSGKRFLKRIQISGKIREEAFRPRFSWRPYVLRAFFDTQLLIAESKGKVAHDFRVFWMGHKGSIESTYTTNKTRLPETLLTEMREAFRRCEEFLDLETREEDPLLKQKDQLHNMIENAAPEKVQEMLRSLGVCNS